MIAAYNSKKSVSGLKHGGAPSVDIKDSFWDNKSTVVLFMLLKANKKKKIITDLIFHFFLLIDPP